MSDQEEEANERRNIFIFGIVFGIINIAALCYLCAFPILDLINYQVIYTGESTYNAYVFTWLVFSWWMVLFFIMGNLLLAFVLFAVLADPKNPSRTDVHTIISAIVLAINIVLFVLFTLCFFFLVDTSFSGRSSFNDPDWCKEFALDHPELCTNNHDPSYTTKDNFNFTILWIFSGIEIVFSFIHLAVNRLLRTSGTVGAPGSNPKEGIIMGLGFTFLYLLAFAYWVAFPLLDTIFIHGYPLLAIPPSPGAYYSVLYGWQWWFLWLYSLNLLPPVFFVLCLVYQRNRLFTSLHFWSSVIIAFATFASLILFFVVWFAFCNLDWSEGSICNDYQACQVFFVSWVNTCANVVGTVIGLGSNPQFNQHLLYGFFFLLLTTVQIWLNYRMKKYGVFK